MNTNTVIEHVQHIAAVRADCAAGRSEIERALKATTALKSWLSSSQAALTSQLATVDSFPERTVGDCTRGSTRDGQKIKERSDTLDKSLELAGALDDGTVTEGHIDAVTNTAKNLDNDEQRTELFDRVSSLVDVASVASVDEWRRRLGVEAKNIRRNDGLDRLERQKRATSMRTWTECDGMICLSGRFDPVTGRKLIGRLDATVEALFAEQAPDTCPTDPVLKQRHLAALALARLADGAAPAGSGRPEYVVVIDTSTSDGAGGPSVDWGIPIEVPQRVLAEMVGDATPRDVHTVIVRNGVVLHASGDLDLGRTTRLASRALRAMYATCAIPGCAVRFDRCKIHHIIWWRNGGRTDLHNLIPVCAHHHSKIHAAAWSVTLGPNRELTVTLPDGTVHNTGPPKRRAA